MENLQLDIYQQTLKKSYGFDIQKNYIDFSYDSTYHRPKLLSSNTIQWKKWQWKWSKVFLRCDLETVSYSDERIMAEEDFPNKFQHQAINVIYYCTYWFKLIKERVCVFKEK